MSSPCPCPCPYQGNIASFKKEAMPKRENNFQPMGICQRLFNFIMSSLTARGLKRVTLGNLASHDSNDVPVEESSRNGEQAGEKSKPIANSEILVEFRHPMNSSPVLIVDQTVENVRDSQSGSHHPYKKKELPIVQENGKSSFPSLPQFQGKSDSRPQKKELPIVQENGKSDFPSLPQFQGKSDSHSPRKELPIVKENGKSNFPFHPQLNGKSDSHNEGKRPQELESPKTTGVQGKGPKKSVSIKDSAGENKKNKGIATPVIEPEETKPKPPKLVRPLLSVVSNINEKSESFLRSRKEAMTRTYSLDQKHN